MGVVTKDVEFYAYVGNDKYHIDTQTGGGHQHSFRHRPEIREDTTTIKPWRKWEFDFDVRRTDGDHRLLRRFALIDPLTGNLIESDMKDMLKTPSIVHDGHAVSYGFHDAGVGRAHRCYVYVTDSHESWMGDLASKDPSLLKIPFEVFALPGSHDAGMYELGIFGSDLVKTLTSAGMLGVGIREIINLALTQKDTISAQLKLGTRFFDFRPGYYFVDGTRSLDMHHQHWIFPGGSFPTFLRDVKQFLEAHPDEIVVTRFGTDRIPPHMLPHDGEVSAYIEKFFHGSSIKPGQFQDTHKPYGKLLEEGTRFIAAYAKDGLASTYADDVNHTTDPRKITAHLDALVRKGLRDDCTYMVFLQGTPSTDWKEALRAISFSDASSPLLRSKPRFDWELYPWIVRNHSAFSHAHLLVFSNDFVDNCLAEKCVAITRQRIKAYKGEHEHKPATMHRILFLEGNKLYRCNEDGTDREQVTGGDVFFGHGRNHKQLLAAQDDICCYLKNYGTGTPLELMIYSIGGKRSDVAIADVQDLGGIHGTNVYFTSDRGIDVGTNDGTNDVVDDGTDDGTDVTEPDTRPGIYVFDTAGTSNRPRRILERKGARRLTIHKTSDDGAAQIYYLSPEPGPFGTHNNELHRCDTDGQNDEWIKINIAPTSHETTWRGFADTSGDKTFVLCKNQVYFVDLSGNFRKASLEGGMAEHITFAEKLNVRSLRGMFVSPDKEYILLNDEGSILCTLLTRGTRFREISSECYDIQFLSDHHVFYETPSTMGGGLLMCDFGGDAETPDGSGKANTREGLSAPGVSARHALAFDKRIYAQGWDPSTREAILLRGVLPTQNVKKIDFQRIGTGHQVIAVSEVPRPMDASIA